jgi:4'-phosphopantetheinyl transferase
LDFNNRIPLHLEKKLIDVSFINPGPFPGEPVNSVHVWKFPVIRTDLCLLTSSEKEFAARFRLEEDRFRFATGREALRLLLSKYLSAPPMEIIIAADKNRKPFISSPPSDIYFNVSHSGDWVLIAFTGAELGIDIEKKDPDFDYKSFLREHYSESEQKYIAEAADPVAAFYFLWTRKEALIKAWGTGLRENLNEVDVLDSDDLFEFNQKHWRLQSFNISLDYPAAVAFPGASDRVFHFDGRGLSVHGFQSY